MTSDGFKLPGYLRLLFLLNTKGSVMVRERRSLGFSLNDVSMLEAYGLIRENNGSLELTEKGKDVLKGIENALLGEGVAKARRILRELIETVDNVLVEIEGYSKTYEGYWLEKTWVHNKLKKKYFYYYLKSRTRKPRSIYLGTIPQDYYLLKDLKQYIARLRYIQQLIMGLLANLDHLEFTKQLLENLEKTQKKIAQIKAKDIPTDSS